MHPLQSLFLLLLRILSLAAGLALLTGCATGFQSAMGFGQPPHSDAMCTAQVATQGGAAEPQIRVAGGPGGRR